jgi:hypothetical protein
MSWINWQQTETLADRYFTSLVGRLGSLVLFLIQGPVIAAILCVIWADAQADQRVELFLCIAALWVGTLNACREICAEWSLYHRERMVFLEIPAYVLSKALVLTGINALQTLSLLWIIDHYVGLPGSKLLLFLALLLGATGGTMLGLAVSALVSSPDKSLALVPLVVLPQLMLSRPFLPTGTQSGLVNSLANCTPLKWSFELYQEIVRLPKGPHWGDLFQALFLCILIIGGLFLTVCALLWWQDE